MLDCDKNQDTTWRRVSKNDDIQVWERIGAESKQLQFRFGIKDNRITTVMAKERDITEDIYEGNVAILFIH